MSKVEPQGWLRIPIGQIAAINPRSFTEEPQESDVVSFVPMAAVEVLSGQMDPSRRRVWREVRSGFVRFQDGDVLFAKITPCMENGKVAIANSLVGGRGAGSTEFHVLRVLGGMDPRYLLFFLLQESVRRDARARMQGAAGQLRVPKQYLEELEIPLAPISEQRLIVAAIEEHLSRLDAAIAGLKRVQAQLPRYRAAVLGAAVEGRLAGVSRDPTDTWKSVPLGELIAEGPQNGLYLPRDRYGRGVPIVRIDDFQEGWSRSSTDLQCVDASSDQRSAYELKPGDLVLNRVNSPSHLGKTMVVQERHVPALFESNMMRFRVTPRAVPSFIDLFLRSHTGKHRLTSNAKGAVNQASINQGDVRATRIDLPSVKEQLEIVAEVERRTSFVEVLDNTVLAEIAHAGRLRQSILVRAFSGQLVPQDPKDEPASALLERIWLGRAKRPATVARGVSGE